MKKGKSVILMALFLTLAATGNVFARELRIAVVDYMKVFLNCPKTIEAKNKLKSVKDAMQKEIDKQIEIFNKLQKELSTRYDQLSNEERRLLLAGLEKQRGLIEQLREQKNTELMTMEKELKAPIVAYIQTIIKLIRKREGYDMVLDSANILDYDEIYDITNLIIQEMQQAALISPNPNR